MLIYYNMINTLYIIMSVKINYFNVLEHINIIITIM